LGDTAVDYAMRLSVASALAASFLMAPMAVGLAPVQAQDFSITNSDEPPAGSRRDVMRQLQAWWDVHGYYPRHASQNDESGIVTVHLVIWRDGNISAVTVVGSSGSSSLDGAATTFRRGFVKPFPEGAPGMELDVSLHYVLAHRHDQPVPADYKPVPSKSPFTITNDPVESKILETMLLRTCTGTIVTEGIRNHPIYGVRSYGSKAIFFRKPDGTPWVQFYQAGYSVLAPVVEVGQLVSWTGPGEHLKGGAMKFVQYTVWPDGDNKLTGNIKADNTYVDSPVSPNDGGTIDLSCATQVVPQIQWSAWWVTAGQQPPGDPP
jgi:TonB family protein